MKFRVAVLLAVAPIVGVAASPRVHAASFNVKPTQIHLSTKVKSGMLGVRNESGVTTRFQLSVFTWSQSAKGEMQLAPTQDIVFFPSMLSLGPGEERQVRIGTTVPAGSTERTYRIFVEELPAAVKAKDAATGKTQVQVLTRMGVPIFIEPAAATAGADSTLAVRIEPKNVRGEKVTFEVKNTSNVHFTIRHARVLGRGAAKENLFERSVDGWYVLAGGSRVFEVEPPKGICAKTKELSFEVETDKTKLATQLDTRSGICGP
jgi:fimbrial chaperone protein